MGTQTTTAEPSSAFRVLLPPKRSKLATPSGCFELVSNQEVIQRAGVLSVEALHKQTRLAWYRRIRSMESYRVPRALVSTRLRPTRLSVGVARHFFDVVKRHLTHHSLDWLQLIPAAKRQNGTPLQKHLCPRTMTGVKGNF